MARRRDDGPLVSGTGRGLVLTVGLGLLVVGAYVLSATIAAGPLHVVVAGLVAAALGIERITFGLTGRRFP